jgi:hypothetical protein
MLNMNNLLLYDRIDSLFLDYSILKFYAFVHWSYCFATHLLRPKKVCFESKNVK